MFNKEVDPNIAKALMEGSNWEKAGFKSITERKEVVSEATEADAPVEQGEVEAEADSCPLCLSELTEPISDEQIAEHLEKVMTIMDVIEESLAKEDSDSEVVEEDSDDEEWEWVEEE